MTAAFYMSTIAPLTRKVNMGAFVDRTGLRYGRLVAQKQVGKDSLKKILWECLCDCGKTTFVNSSALSSGNTSSCGCHGGNFIHGGTGKSSYNSWKAMMARCYHSQNKDYKRWGACGVTVCERWHDYLNFVADMGEPIGTQTLDRIDSAGNYEPINCRWAFPSEQARNICKQKRNTTGVIGVRSTTGRKGYKPGRFYAQITIGKTKKFSRIVDTIEEATALRKELEKRYW